MLQQIQTALEANQAIHLALQVEQAAGAARFRIDQGQLEGPLYVHDFEVFARVLGEIGGKDSVGQMPVGGSLLVGHAVREGAVDDLGSLFGRKRMSFPVAMRR